MFVISDRNGFSSTYLTPTAAARWWTSSHWAAEADQGRVLHVAFEKPEPWVPLEGPEVLDAPGGEIVQGPDFVSAAKQLFRQV
jgi:hypothetical protein